MTEYVSFEETIGIYDGDPSIGDSALAYIYELRDKHPESDGHSNYGGWQKQLDHPIKHVIEQEFRQYIKHYGVEEPYWVSFTRFFCNINPPGASNMMHHHKVGEFSGAFWLKAKEDSGDLIIMNPFYNRFMNTCVITPEKDYNAMHFKPQPNKGVFFNSNLIHYVDINRSHVDRVSIAYHIGIHY
jgi:uncharacterized protein (TIGR02466 family)